MMNWKRLEKLEKLLNPQPIWSGVVYRQADGSYKHMDKIYKDIGDLPPLIGRLRGTGYVIFPAPIDEEAWLKKIKVFREEIMKAILEDQEYQAICEESQNEYDEFIKLKNQASRDRNFTFDLPDPNLPKKNVDDKEDKKEKFRKVLDGLYGR